MANEISLFWSLTNPPDPGAEAPVIELALTAVAGPNPTLSAPIDVDTWTAIATLGDTQVFSSPDQQGFQFLLFFDTVTGRWRTYVGRNRAMLVSDYPAWVSGSTSTGRDLTYNIDIRKDGVLVKSYQNLRHFAYTGWSYVDWGSTVFASPAVLRSSPLLPPLEIYPMYERARANDGGYTASTERMEPLRLNRFVRPMSKAGNHPEQVETYDRTRYEMEEDPSGHFESLLDFAEAMAHWRVQIMGETNYAPVDLTQPKYQLTKFSDDANPYDLPMDGSGSGIDALDADPWPDNGAHFPEVLAVAFALTQDPYYLFLAGFWVNWSIGVNAFRHEEGLPNDLDPSRAQTRSFGFWASVFFLYLHQKASISVSQLKGLLLSGPFAAAIESDLEYLFENHSERVGQNFGHTGKSEGQDDNRSTWMYYTILRAQSTALWSGKTWMEPYFDKTVAYIKGMYDLAGLTAGQNMQFTDGGEVFYPKVWNPEADNGKGAFISQQIETIEQGYALSLLANDLASAVYDREAGYWAADDAYEGQGTFRDIRNLMALAAGISTGRGADLIPFYDHLEAHVNRAKHGDSNSNPEHGWNRSDGIDPKDHRQPDAITLGNPQFFEGLTAVNYTPAADDPLYAITFQSHEPGALAVSAVSADDTPLEPLLTAAKNPNDSGSGREVQVRLWKLDAAGTAPLQMRVVSDSPDLALFVFTAPSSPYPTDLRVLEERYAEILGLRMRPVSNDELFFTCAAWRDPKPPASVQEDGFATKRGAGTVGNLGYAVATRTPRSIRPWHTSLFLKDGGSPRGSALGFSLTAAAPQVTSDGIASVRGEEVIT